MNCACFHKSGDCCEDSATGGMEVGQPVTGGTAKEVLYVDLAGNLAQDSNFVYDPSTQAVGIRTITPGTFGALEVAPDVDGVIAAVGHTKIGSVGVAVDEAWFGHFDQFSAGGAAVKATALGVTKINAATAKTIDFQIADTSKWRIDANGHLIAVTDNAVDIGADGATRPRNIRAAGVVLPGNGAVGAPAFGFDADETTGLYRIGASQVGLALGGVLNASFGVTGPDVDLIVGLGRALIDSRTTDRACFSHRDASATAEYAIQQLATGETRVNCKTGTNLLLRAADTTRVQINGTGIGFFATAAVALQTGPTVNITNNVTAGGTDGTIANFTDLTIYANDAASIRNNQYQLARGLKFVSDALRAYGLIT